ncbi:transposase [Hydrogenophaga flava]|uniref:transposase n=1 Tax=Hydrogenophaga flava TaxID=65657 RepID=UPI000A054A72|nr:transposase [Hydrogenophaga flava]
MDWLSEVVVSRGRMQGLVFKDKGEVEYLDVGDFYQSGIPKEEDIVIRARLDSADFSPAESEDVLPHFGLVLPQGRHNKHTLWQVAVQNRRLFVPALALMRAMFVPTRFMLEEFFKPQAIDQVSWSNQEAPPTIHLEASWARQAKGLRLRDPTPLLAWIHSCPTARVMADSVHVSALSGKVHMELPLCQMDLRLRGIAHSTGVLVTTVEVMSIESREASFPGGDAPKLCIPGKSRKRPTAYAPHKELQEYSVLENSQGTVFISDEEWPEILETLQKFRDVRTGRLDKRQLLDGILVKLHTKKPWRKCAYRVGSWNNAAQTFRDMEEKGSLLPVLKYLRESRST